jgi:hypothetical protein
LGARRHRDMPEITRMWLRGCFGCGSLQALSALKEQGVLDEVRPCSSPNAQQIIGTRAQQILCELSCELLRRKLRRRAKGPASPLACSAGPGSALRLANWARGGAACHRFAAVELGAGCGQEHPHLRHDKLPAAESCRWHAPAPAHPRHQGAQVHRAFARAGLALLRGELRQTRSRRVLTPCETEEASCRSLSFCSCYSLSFSPPQPRKEAQPRSHALTSD